MIDMKFAVVSNLHGNLLAISSLLSEIEKLKEEGEQIDRIYVLGVFGYFPYAKEVCKLISNANNIIAIRGFFDHAISRFSYEEEKSELSEFELDIVKWNYENLDRECRRWIRNEVPAFLAEKFGNNEILFVYGSPFDPIRGEVKPKQPTSYYESILAPFRKYKLLIVAGKEEFIAETAYGKVVCPGALGFYQREKKPSYAIVDSKTLDVYFGNIEFDRAKVESRIKESGLPEEVVEILYHGKIS